MFDKNVATMLLQELRNEQSIIFAGAGLGVEAGLPDWKQALEQMADYIGQYDNIIKEAMYDRIKKKNYLAAADLYYQADTLEENKLKGLEMTFGKEPNITRNVKMVTKLKICQFMTTNYDHILENAWASVHRKSLPSLLNDREGFQSSFRLMNQNKPYVVHLHGALLNPNSIVLARYSYEKIKKHEPYYTFLRHALRTKSIIFLGLSIEDPAMKAFLEYTKDNLQLICSNPSFFLISKDEKDKINHLKESGIYPIWYDPSNNHAGLWELINWLVDELENPKYSKIPFKPTEDQEISKLKHSLAAIYTHLKIRRTHQNIYESILDGIVRILAGVADKPGDEPTLERISEQISMFFNIGKEKAELIANRSMKNLIEAKVASQRDGKYLFARADTAINDDLNVLVKAIKDRSRLRYSYEIKNSDETICEYLLMVLVIDGVRIAHSIMTDYPMPDSSIEDILNRSYCIVFKEKPSSNEPLINATQSLLAHPNQNEAKILGSISRTAFISDLTLHEPDLMSLNIKRQFQRVALDASILLPALCEYHPRYSIYQDIIRKTKEHGVKVSASEGFLEEIVIHRARAIETFKKEFVGQEKRFRNYVMFNGSDNINVFLGGFSGWATQNHSFDFHKYLSECAPYSTIDNLAAYLDGKGIVRENPIGEHSLEASHIALWKSALKNWYYDHRRRKADSLLWHEAIQLETLSVTRVKGPSSAFLTADKGFISAVGDISSNHELDSSVIHNIVMPIQYSYYIDLDEERNIDWRAYSKVLWSKSFQENEIRYSEYFIDKILQEYEPKLIDSLPKIINEISEEIDRSPTIEEKYYQDDEVRIKEFKYIEDFEDKFYEIMNEEKKKLDLL